MDYFFSYGDQKYTQSKLRIKNEALNFGFDKINIYGREDLDMDFLEKTNPYINSPRGGGYWLWKCYFLKKIFNEMDDGDFCVYADAGCTINPNGKQRYELYKKLISESGSGILSFRMDGLDEERYTTEEIFKHFEIESDSEIRLTGQIMATILVFCKNKKSQRLIDEYYNLAITKPNIFSDDFNYLSNSPRFVDNRHDQSILSVMRKKYVTSEIQDETYADSMDGWHKLYYETKIPFLATRIRN
jgi:hypothetical protein